MAKIKRPDEAIKDFLKTVETIKQKSKEAEEKFKTSKEKVKK